MKKNVTAIICVMTILIGLLIAFLWVDTKSESQGSPEATNRGRSHTPMSNSLYSRVGRFAVGQISDPDIGGFYGGNDSDSKYQTFDMIHSLEEMEENNQQIKPLRDPRADRLFDIWSSDIRFEIFGIDVSDPERSSGGDYERLNREWKREAEELLNFMQEYVADMDDTESVEFYNLLAVRSANLYVKRVFERFDTDNNGKLEDAENTAYVKAMLEAYQNGMGTWDPCSKEKKELAPIVRREVLQL